MLCGEKRYNFEEAAAQLVEEAGLEIGTEAFIEKFDNRFCPVDDPHGKRRIYIDNPHQDDKQHKAKNQKLNIMKWLRRLGKILFSKILPNS